MLSQDDGFTESSLAVVDIDGDGSLDIPHGDEGRRIFAWGDSGNSPPGFPLPFTAAVGDGRRPRWPAVFGLDPRLLATAIYDVSGDFARARGTPPRVPGPVT